jgi:hypothetical protein
MLAGPITVAYLLRAILVAPIAGRYDRSRRSLCGQWQYRGDQHPTNDKQDRGCRRPLFLTIPRTRCRPGSAVQLKDGRSQW